ncbi:MAG: 1,4-dihydroxy-2-naphthoate polyprenyltransferase [Chlamydiae bacterium]|nr:1,4-dihydroxy-2-naphthoate polyprenyltransferase [Chlamydiota bacterium]
MTRLQIWILASRPKTLAAVLCPVFIGTTMAFDMGIFNGWVFLLTLLTGLGIQVSTNFCNDYFDFIKGADTKDRKGPLRVTQAGLVSIQTMKKACIIALVSTALIGSYLIWHGGVVIGLLLFISLLLAVGYTAGPIPLAYKGLGDLFVFLFFGPVACLSTFYLQTFSISLLCNISSLSLGALSTAILAVNNLRDMEEDEKSGKRTLAVRFGIAFGKMEYATLLFIPSIITLVLAANKPWVLLSLLYLFPAGITLFKVLNPTHSDDLNRCLGKTGFILLIYTCLFCLGWLIS